MENTWQKKVQRRKILKNVNYAFAKPINKSLVHRRNLHPRLRSLLNVVKNILEYILRKKYENKKLNQEILISMGLDPYGDVSDLDAVYKKEFRKKKYIYLCRGYAKQKKEKPLEFFYEYIPPNVSKNKAFSFSNFSKSFFKPNK